MSSLVIINPLEEALVITWILLLVITVLMVDDTFRWIKMVIAEGETIESQYDAAAGIQYRVVMGRVCNQCGAGIFPQDARVCWNCKAS